MHTNKIYIGVDSNKDDIIKKFHDTLDMYCKDNIDIVLALIVIDDRIYQMVLDDYYDIVTRIYKYFRNKHGYKIPLVMSSWEIIFNTQMETVQ